MDHEHKIHKRNIDITVVALEQALDMLGQLLADRGEYHEVVIIGGGGLLLLRYIERTTKDLDLIALVKEGKLITPNPLPHGLLQAVDEVGRALELGKEWFNTGPASLLDLGLPSGFEKRMQTSRYGSLIVHLASRFDQICFKLYAAIDQGPYSKHFSDLKVLSPTREELVTAKEWCITQDASQEFVTELDKAVYALETTDGSS